MTTNEMTTTGAELGLPRGIAHTATSLVLPDGLSVEQWADVGRYLQAAQRAALLWRADWLSYGQKRFSEAEVTEAAVQLDFEFRELRALEVLGRVEAAERRPALTTEHHFVVAKRVKDAVERDVWLRRAEAEGLSPRELQASIRAGEVVRIDSEKRRLRFPSPGAVRRAFDDWQAALGPGWVKSWTLEDCEAVAAELRPIVEFREEVLRRRDELKFGPAVERAKSRKRFQDTIQDEMAKWKPESGERNAECGKEGGR